MQSIKVGTPAAKAARYDGLIDDGGIPAGQSAGLIRTVKPAGQIVDDIMAEATTVLHQRFGAPASAGR